MAAEAELVPLADERARVGEVAVVAGDPRLCHSAAKEGPALEDLVADLPVGPVQRPVGEAERDEVVEEGVAGLRGLGERGPPGVAGEAGVESRPAITGTTR